MLCAKVGRLLVTLIPYFGTSFCSLLPTILSSTRGGFLLMIMLLLTPSVEATGRDSTSFVTTFHQAASVFTGAVTVGHQAIIAELRSSRLRPSSDSKVRTAINKHWLPFLLRYGRDEDFIANGDPDRGGIMASFSIDLWKIGGLAFGTIQGYVWAVCEAHLQSGFSSPLDNVQDWGTWMKSLEVQAFVPGEPHAMLEFDLFTRMLGFVDRSDRFEVACATMYLMLYYTHSRSEYPVPKARSGAYGFDPLHHTRFCDFRDGNGFAEWGIGATKADPRNKRSRGDSSHRQWRPVGHATGILNMLYWVALYFSLCSRSCWPSQCSPFFLGNDGLYILYHQALGFLRTLLMRVPGVSSERAHRYGLHSLRVLGYNAHRAANGEDVAALNGGWTSACHRQYGRETLLQILSFAQAGADAAARMALPPMPLDRLPASVPPSEPALPDNVYVIDHIVRHDSRRRKYLVRWEGYGPAHDTWEPASSLLHTDALARFRFLQSISAFPAGYTLVPS